MCACVVVSKYVCVYICTYTQDRGRVDVLWGLKEKKRAQALSQLVAGLV